MSERMIWKNGQYLPESEATISVYDAGMMQITCFEMLRSFNKVHFRLKEHLERLFTSMKFIGVQSPYTINELMDVCNELVIMNSPMFDEGDEHRLLINVSSGALGIYKHVSGVVNGPNIIITDFPLRWTVAGMSKLYEFGVNAIIPNQKAIPSSLMENRVKNHCRLHVLRANMEISQFEGDRNWALLTTPDGIITEFVGSNIFIVKGNTLITPKSINVLNGISRKYVMNTLASNLGLDVVEDDILPWNVLTANECFATCTPASILPVVSLNGQAIGTGAPGRITTALLKQWSKNVDINIPLQIANWDRKYSADLNGSSPYQFKAK